MALPCVLFSSSDENYNPKQFVKSILDVDDLPAPKAITNDIEGYQWNFENKYYKTSVHLCTTNNPTIGDQDFSDALEAFVIYFDPNQVSSFELSKSWIPYLNHIEPEIKMLVCNCSRENDAVGRKETLEWCLKNGFEMVELKPDQDEEEEDDFPETTGMERIIQAFNAHTWPNLEMKDSPPVQSPLVRQMMKEQHDLNEQNKSLNNSNHNNSNHNNSNPGEDNSPHTETESACGENKTTTNCQTSEKPGVDPLLDQFGDIDWKTLLADDSQSDVPLSEGDTGIEDFEQLFTKLKVMKDKAEKLPEQERRKYAENVAISFWKAIGGDEDEILGLDESDGD